MWGCTAIGINNNFAAGEARIAIWPANDESACWVDVKCVFRSHPTLWHNIFNKRAHHFAHIRVRQTLGMLG